MHSRQKLHCMPIPLSTGLILRQGLDVVENYSRAQASLELPDSVFPVASIICTWHEGDREGLGKWFLPGSEFESPHARYGDRTLHLQSQEPCGEMGGGAR